MVFIDARNAMRDGRVVKRSAATLQPSKIAMGVRSEEYKTFFVDLRAHSTV